MFKPLFSTVLFAALLFLVLEKVAASVEFEEVFNGYSDSEDIELISFFSADDALDKGFLFLLTKAASIGQLKNNYVVELKKISVLGRNEVSTQAYPEGTHLRSSSIMVYKKHLYLLAQISEKKLELLKYNQNKMELIERKKIELPNDIVSIENIILGEKLEIYVVAKSIDQLVLLRINSSGQVLTSKSLAAEKGKVISVLGMRLYGDHLFLSGVLYKNESNFGWLAEFDKKGKLLHSGAVGGQQAQLISSLKRKVIINKVDDKNRVMQLAELVDSNEKIESSLTLVKYGQYSPEVLHVCDNRYMIMNKVKSPNKKTSLFIILNGRSTNKLELSSSKNLNLVEAGNKVYRNYKFFGSRQNIFAGLTAIKLDDAHRLRVSVEVLKLQQVPDCR